MEWLLLAVVVVAAYLIGSIPMGYIWVKVLTGQDVRTIGSGRTGGTNATRAGGLKAGVLTGIADFLKGVVGILLAHWLVPSGPLAQWTEAAAALAAVIGHNWSLYNHFKGGAGTGPNIGAATMLFWPLGLVLVPLVPILLITTGYASVTSMVACALVPVTFLVLSLMGTAPWAYVIYSTIAFVLVLVALRPNIERLRNGTERMVGPRAKRLGRTE